MRLIRKPGREGSSTVSVSRVTEVPAPDEKRMRLRYAGTCRACGVALPAKEYAIYEKSTKTVRCVE